MKIIRVASATLNQTPLDWDKNRHNILDAIGQARAAEATLLCLPELCICGYGCEDAFLSPTVQQTALSVLQDLIPHTGGIAVTMGLPLLVDGALYNVSALVVDGELTGFAAKRHLAGDGIHYEPRWFNPWPADHRGRVTIKGQTNPIPVGSLLFEIDTIYIGFEICEDAWVAGRPGIQLAGAGADIILNPSASHFSFGKHEVRKSFVVEGSRALSVTYLYANLVGNEAGRIVYDGGAMIASDGTLLCEGPRLHFKDVQLVVADVDVAISRMHRTSKTAVAPQHRPGLVVRCDARLWPPRLAVTQQSHPPGPPMTRAAEFARAVSLGLFDYMRKSHSRGFVISLSGGADSAAVALLVHLIFAFAKHDIGVHGLKQKLAYLDLDPGQYPNLTEQLLTCVYQATRNSGDVTRSAAGALARELGATFFMWDVEQLVAGYTSTVEGALKRKLDWSTDDLALQNIQARVRAPGVWMLANVYGALLLSTSNRSEAAVGYATMDGDTSGGLCPIAGIDKAYLLKWLKIMETEGLPETGNFPILNVITAQQPTAELRPGTNQTDEGDLMPYPVLERIEKLAIRDRKGPIATANQLGAEYPTQSAEQINQWVTRFFTLFSRNQWKRERYAPSFHLDDENLDPKTWCRFPILSGGFKKELAQLASRTKR